LGLSQLRRFQIGALYCCYANSSYTISTYRFSSFTNNRKYVNYSVEFLNDIIIESTRMPRFLYTICMYVYLYTYYSSSFSRIMYNVYLDIRENKRHMCKIQIMTISGDEEVSDVDRYSILP